MSVSDVLSKWTVLCNVFLHLYVTVCLSPLLHSRATTPIAVPPSSFGGEGVSAHPELSEYYPVALVN